MTVGQGEGGDGASDTGGAVDAGAATVDFDLARSGALGARHLRELLIADRYTTSLGVVVLIVLMLTTTVSVPFIFLIGLVAAMGLLRQLGLRSINEDRADSAVGWFALGSWGVSLGAVWIIPKALPILVITLAIPAVLAAIYLSDRQVRLITAGLILASGTVGVVAEWTDGAGLEEQLDPTIVSLTFVGFLAVQNLPLVMAVRYASRQHRSALAAAIVAMENAQRASSEVASSRARLARVADVERRRVERDLHDGAQQMFVSALLQLRVADTSIKRGLPLGEEKMAEIADGIEEGIDELRRLARGIYPSLLQARGLWEALHGLARNSGVAVDVIGDDCGRLPNEIETALYFVASEALQNVAKHAGPDASAELRLTTVGDEIILSIADDGAGIPVDVDGMGSNGVNNMRDRVAAVGGVTTFRNRSSGGAEVLVTVPRQGTVDPGFAPEPLVGAVAGVAGS